MGTALIELTGTGGALMHSYQVAAGLGRWSLMRVRGGWFLTADLRDVHEHWIHERPLNVVVAFAAKEWQWDDISPEIAHGRLSAHIPCEPTRKQ